MANSITEVLVSLFAEELGLLRVLNEKLSSLTEKMSVIESVLVDAEKKQVQSNQVKVWLTILEDFLYEVDDLMDEVNTEALRLQVMTGSNIAKQVRTFFSPSNQLVFRRKMNTKIKAIKRRLDEISDNRDRFSLEEPHEESDRVVTTVTYSTRLPYSSVPDEEVFGRDRDREAIINLLFDDKIEQQVVSVVAIAGCGGPGKTTLAQLVFNNPMVTKHFKPRVWVHASRDFDMAKLLHRIAVSEIGYEAKYFSESELHRSLRQKLKSKRLLIVLDDVGRKLNGGQTSKHYFEVLAIGVE